MAARIITAESVDMDYAFSASGYDRGSGDDYKLPHEQEYELSVTFVNAQRAGLHEFDKREAFTGCMPIEVMASRRGYSLRSPASRGLRDRKQAEPWAVLQLRKENAQGRS